MYHKSYIENMKELLKSVIPGSAPGTYYSGGLKIVTNVASMWAQTDKYPDALEGRMEDAEGNVLVPPKHNWARIVGVMNGQPLFKELVLRASDITFDRLAALVSYEDDDFSHHFFKVDDKHALALKAIKPYLEKLVELDPFDVEVFFRDVNFTPILVLVIDGESTMLFAPAEITSLASSDEAEIIENW